MVLNGVYIMGIYIYIYIYIYNITYDNILLSYIIL